MDDPTPGEAPGTGDQTIHCDQCGEVVPNLTYCVRCGDPLGQEQRHGRAGRVREDYAAVPGERANSLHLVSTIYPALPREEIRTFQLTLLAGAILVAVLGALGFFPVAIVAAAVLVPLVTVIYVYDVDVYEDEPIRVIGFTFLWGLVTGGLFAYAANSLFPVTAADIVGGSAIGGGGGVDFPWVRGVVLPIISVLVMIAGPLVLLTYKRFNDVLDGATFGLAAGVAFVGAQTLVTSAGLLESGLRPAGDPAPWVVRLLVLGVGSPVIAAGAIGGLGGALWLRYRAPVKDRGRLGPIGQPVVAFVIAAALLVVASLAELLLPDQLGPELITLVIVAIVAVVALLWLRRVIHLGLLEEADEIPIGPVITCPECGKQTPSHTYCGNCGASLKALPRNRQGLPAPAAVAGDLNAPYRTQPKPPDAAELPTGAAASLAAGASAAAVEPRRHGWLDQRALLALFAVVLLGAVAVAAVVAFAQGQDRDQPPCPDPSIPCAGVAAALGAGLPGSAEPLPQIPTGHPFADRQRYTDQALGFSFEFDPTLWSIDTQQDGFVVLQALAGNVVLIFDAGQASDWDPDSLLGAERDLWSQRLLGFAEDTEPARELLGTPILGYQDGRGGLFGGTIDSSQGPSLDMTVAMVAASDGRITTAAVLLAPVELQTTSGETIGIRDLALGIADSVVNTFTWPADGGAQ